MSTPGEIATLEIDHGQRIRAWDAAAERLFGTPRAEALGQPLAAFLRLPADFQGFLDRIPRGAAAAVDVALPAAAGEVPVLLTAAARESSFALQVLPAPGRHGIDAARHLAAIVESSDDAIVSKDLDGIVLTWNRGAERIFGYTAEEMVGRSIRTIIPDDRQSEEDVTLATIRRGEPLNHFETIRRTKSGSLVPISLTVSPIRGATGAIVGASKIARDISALQASERERIRLLEESIAITETLNEVGAAVASDLDRASVVQAVTDAATELTTAAFGAFFYNVQDAGGGTRMLYTVSGAPREAFAEFPMPRNTEIFAPTFTGATVVRSPDITRDSRYGHNRPYAGMPPGHLPVRSYLAVPVKTRDGGAAGGLFFGHPDPDRFTEQHERLAVGIAAWASVALENARLYGSAQEAIRLKDEFLASLSHELRTPLNAILGYARIVRSGLVGPDRLQKAIETIERNAGALAQIVEDVLDVSRIVVGKLRLNVQPVDVPDVVRASIDGVRPAADAKGVRLEIMLDPQASPISGDPDRLQQILWNLLSNAVKFTRRGGKVQVRLARVNSHLELTVSDTGIGIAPEFLPHVFERFRQADGGMTREQGGLGLGLAIAKQMVELHGGTITAESAGLGTGATFRVKLPIMIVHPSRDAEQRVQPRARAAAAADAGIANLAGLHVLAVDDDSDALALMADVLRAAGAEVTLARSAAGAIEALEAAVPDVLVADIGMPTVDGFGLIARVRRHENPAIQRLPAAALTAYARSEDRVKTLRAGFQTHLAKPIEPAELTAAVAALAAREPRHDP